MQAFYCDLFVLPLPPGHRFPMEKYRLLREAALASGALSPEDLAVPEAATREEILRVHDAGYVERVERGELTPAEVRRIGFPWSRAMVERCLRSAGGTLAACRAALQTGLAVNLAGGTHHAFRDRGEGYCVWNDAAIAARAMQAEGRAGRVLIVDCDVHQGNGTAAIFAADPTVYTLSLHGRHNFPFHKEKSDLDIELEDGTGDAAYLAALEEGLSRALPAAAADLAIYVAGADPHAGDRLGRLSLSTAGLAERDRRVFERLRRAGLPTAAVMAGGYGREVADTVAVHLGTVTAARRSWEAWQEGVS
ncbi:MAG TPA: histone deacetylase [Thermoanaerobaculia bacterium]|nr:histone deacetylase [Thermoanaerobaculia bacterium]